MFGSQAEAALDTLALLDFAWHDCYGEPCPPDRVLEDVWNAGGDSLALFIQAAHLAVLDFRDLRLWVDGLGEQD